MSARTKLLSTTIFTSIGAAFITTTHASAADVYTKAPAAAVTANQPAVDGLNWKVDGLGGSLADRSLGATQASVTVPLGGQFGFQLDGSLGSFDRRFFGAGAAHFFWRDPSRGLLGIYASHTYWNHIGGLHVTQVAGEGEAYLGRFTLQGIAGVESGNSRTALTGVTVTPTTVVTFADTFDVKTRFFDQINLAYYPTDNTKVFVGHRYLGGQNALALGGEAALPSLSPMMLAAFVEGRIGENGHHGIWGGLRGYFGQSSKSLIQRHRQDDPLTWLVGTLFSITNSLNQTSAGVNLPPPDGDGDGCDGDGDCDGG